MTHWHHDYGTFTLVCWGNGLSYSLKHKPSGREYFAQGDDADLFERDRDTAERCWPEKTNDEIMGWLWDQLEYGNLAQ